MKYTDEKGKEHDALELIDQLLTLFAKLYQDVGAIDVINEYREKYVLILDRLADPMKYLPAPQQKEMNDEWQD